MSQRIVHSGAIGSGLQGIHPLLTPAILIGGMGAFLLFNLRSGQDWDGDFALYLMNAQNILHGLPYANSAYLFNPANAINPTAYPPGFPLLIVPVIYFFGLDLGALKVECIFALLLFLCIFWTIARHTIGSFPALAVTAAFGLHPFVVRSTNLLNSEFPFMLFCYSALLLFERLQSGRDVPRPTLIKYILFAAFVTSLAYLTRSIGVLLWPAAFVASVWRTKRVLSPTTGALAVAVVICVAIQSKYKGDVGTYVNYFQQFTPRGLITNAYLYLHISLTMLGTGRISIWFCSMILILAAIGFASRLRTLSVLECFFVFYIGFLVVYPIALEVKRYEMPVWPLLFLYAAHGLNLITKVALTLPGRAVGAAVVFFASLLYVGQIRHLDFRPISPSVLDTQARELFAAIRNLPPEARVLSGFPTIVALYTGYTSSTWPDKFTETELSDYMRRSHIAYIVQEHPPVAPTAGLDDIDRFIDRNKSSLQRIFANDRFSVYQVNALSGTDIIGFDRAHPKPQAL